MITASTKQMDKTMSSFTKPLKTSSPNDHVHQTQSKVKAPEENAVALPKELPKKKSFAEIFADCIPKQGANPIKLPKKSTTFVSLVNFRMSFNKMKVKDISTKFQSFGVNVNKIAFMQFISKQTLEILVHESYAHTFSQLFLSAKVQIQRYEDLAPLKDKNLTEARKMIIKNRFSRTFNFIDQLCTNDAIKKSSSFPKLLCTKSHLIKSFQAMFNEDLAHETKKYSLLEQSSQAVGNPSPLDSMELMLD
jgi:hypothetical protein